MSSQATVDYLHISKTGGTSLRHIFKEHSKKAGASPIRRVWLHYMTLPRICAEHPQVRTIFFVRDPVSHFVSGFNCRLRKGLPRHHVPWFPEEAAAFRLFTTPNELAEAISHPNPQRREAAMAAMVNIRHVSDTLTRHLGGTEFLAGNVNRIFYIGDLASFDLDLTCLKAMLQIDDDTGPPTDDIGANRSPEHLDRHLSDLAVQNLKDWYQRDYAIYRWCQAHRQRMWSTPSAHMTH